MTEGARQSWRDQPVQVRLRACRPRLRGCRGKRNRHQDHHSPQQDRSGKPGCHYRDCARLDCVSGRGFTGLAGRCRYRRWAAIPLNPQGRQDRGTADGSERVRYRQDTCRARRARSEAIRRPLITRWLSDISREAWRFDLQDDGCQPASVGRYAPGLCPRCRDIQGSRWRWAALTSAFASYGHATAQALGCNGRVEDGRGSLGHAATLRFPSPLPAHRTGRADFPHPALRPASP
jgi:hypothetical protein